LGGVGCGGWDVSGVRHPVTARRMAATTAVMVNLRTTVPFKR
jgi:hypothetical protein